MRQYFCKICGNLFNQSGPGNLRQYCDEHKGKQFRPYVLDGRCRTYNREYARKRRPIGRLDQALYDLAHLRWVVEEWAMETDFSSPTKWAKALMFEASKFPVEAKVVSDATSVSDKEES